jgi:hypothetical protein
MDRLCFSLSIVVVLAILLAAPARAVDTGPLTAENMKVALHTATVQEGHFIERVLYMVKKGKLPLDLVQSTFLWAKKKPAKKFYYFKQGLILRASAQGIKILPKSGDQAERIPSDARSTGDGAGAPPPPK